MKGTFCAQSFQRNRTFGINVLSVVQKKLQEVKPVDRISIRLIWYIFCQFK